MPRLLLRAALPIIALTATAAGAEIRTADARDVSLEAQTTLDRALPAEPQSVGAVLASQRWTGDDAALGTPHTSSTGAVVQRPSGPVAKAAAATASRIARLPEPATWVMLIMGFGVIGGLVRRGLKRSDARFDAYIRSITEDADA